jgi:serine/threonine protein phosphatase PrpC
MTIATCGHDTHVGRVRGHNEDTYLIEPSLGLGIVADGMGGHECGEVASKIVVDCVRDEVRNGTPVAQALLKAHHAVLNAAERGQGRCGMGSTALAIKMDASRFEIVWVGDSRAYIWSGGRLTQITRDHSLVQQLVDQGEITLEQARTHPQRNYITQAIGMLSLEHLEVGRVQGNLHRGQQILLCSDGLNGEVTDEEIAQILAQDLSEQEKVDLLIQKALDNGGSDNVTVLLVSGPENSPN